MMTFYDLTFVKIFSDISNTGNDRLHHLRQVVRCDLVTCIQSQKVTAGLFTHVLLDGGLGFQSD